ncbi:MAG: transposase [Bacteroidales bacterium]
MPNLRDIPLEHGNYYHIYNRGNNGETLFHTPQDYRHFISLYDKYIPTIANTYAWCLMGNHFHLLVRIKEESEIGYLKELSSSMYNGHGRLKWQLTHNPPESEDSGGICGKKPIPHKMFSHLFGSYTKHFNLKNNRTGSLIEKNFRRLNVTSEKYFQNLVLYIHQNPAHHQLNNDFREYPWSSYQSIISVKPTKVDRKTVLEWFNGKKNFIETHQRIVDPSIMDEQI